MQRVLEVSSANSHILKSNPVRIHVYAAGKVPTGGWSNPQLGAWYYVVPPSDGIQDFDFYATEPSGIAADVISPIVVEAIIERDPLNYWGKGKPLGGIRIHAVNNSVVASLDSSKSRRKEAGPGDDPVPWPLQEASVLPKEAKADARINRGLPLTALIGKSVRVYRTGDFLTSDLNLNRANIELNPKTNMIVDVWFG